MTKLWRIIIQTSIWVKPSKLLNHGEGGVGVGGGGALIEVIANLYGCIGNAYLEMGSYDKALENHHTDLNMFEAK